MYHDVTQREPANSGGKEYFAVSLSTLEAHLDRLADLGLRACGVEQALTATEPRVAISFDDGDAGQFDHAFPALAKRGMSATFFVTTGWVGEPGYVSWDGLREAKAAGMSVQSHTRTHPFLSELNPEQLWDELFGSRDELDERLEQRTVALALPGGDPPRSGCWPTMADAGYSMIATSRWGVNGPIRPGTMTWIHRCAVQGPLVPTMFRRIVEGDRWLLWERTIREGTLRAIRRLLGPSRYHDWRRALFDTLAGSDAFRNRT